MALSTLLFPGLFEVLPEAFFGFLPGLIEAGEPPMGSEMGGRWNTKRPVEKETSSWALKCPREKGVFTSLWLVFLKERPAAKKVLQDRLTTEKVTFMLKYSTYFWEQKQLVSSMA